jgi:hypothetical protein
MVLTEEGLIYEEEGEDGTKVEKLIPRCDEELCYKYTHEKLSEKQRLCRTLAMDYPDMCRTMIDIMVDSWLNHPEKMDEAMRKDAKFMRRLVN